MAVGFTLGTRAQTEMRFLNPRDYASIDTMWYVPDTVTTVDSLAASLTYRFLTIENRDSSVSIYDCRRHWMSPKFWGVDRTGYDVFYICDNLTTSVFYVCDAVPGRNWLVTMSGDRVEFPSCFTLDTIPGGMLTLEYGADRYMANANAYASLRTKARPLIDRLDSVPLWTSTGDTARSVELRTAYAIDYPQGSEPVDGAVRRWISSELARNVNASATDSAAIAVLDAASQPDTAAVYRYYAQAFDSVVSCLHGLGMNKATILQRARWNGLVTYLADCNAYAGGASGRGSFCYATFDSTAGRLLTSRDIINASSHAAVDKLIADELNRQLDAAGLPGNLTASQGYNPDGNENAVSDFWTASCAFLPSGVVFSYQPYEIAQDNDFYFVVIPYSRIQPYLKINPGKITN